MKLMILPVALLVTVASASLVDYLNSMQRQSSFRSLSDREKRVFGGLVAAAENNKVTEYVNIVGLTPVLRLLAHFSRSDAERFAAYLAELGREDVVNKRDDEGEDHHGHLHSYLSSLHSAYYQHLPEMEKQIFMGLKDAASQKQVTQYIDSVGYGAIFGLLEHLDPGHSHQVSSLIEAALAAEAVAVSMGKRRSHPENLHGNLVEPGHENGVKKRDDEREDHHGHLHSYLNSLQSAYYQHLPTMEKQIFMGLKDAAIHKQITQYIDSVGYGAIFGLLEHLDSDHSYQVSNLIEGALAAEAVPMTKRDDEREDHHGHLYSYLNSSAYYQHLPTMEKQIFMGLKDAATRKQITQYIDSVGYGAIFGLLEHLDSDHSYQVSNLIEGALAAEAVPVTVSKRIPDFENFYHHGNFHSYLIEWDTYYAYTLPDMEWQTFQDIKAAVHDKTLLAYLKTVGYGPVFGIIEYLDRFHADRFNDYLTKALEAEISATTQQQRE